MKKLIALAVALMSAPAMADIGPVYVSVPGYCNVKKLYVTPLNQLYGYEIGCSGLLGQPAFGVFDSFGNVLLSTTQGSGFICMDKYRPDGLIQSSCSNGATVTNLNDTLRYSVSLTQPANALIRSTAAPATDMHQYIQTQK